MEKIIVDGGYPLSGKVDISGMKNAAVAVIFASVVVSGVCIIDNLPCISDVSDSLEILKSIGARVRAISGTAVEIDTTQIADMEAPLDLVRRLRASYYLAGAMLGRFGHAKVGLPGGCDFGVRPIDLHVKAFEKLGAEVSVGGGCIEAVSTDGVHGSSIYFDCSSVGATINTIIAAVLADGSTVIENAAREPHIVDLASFLNACGADIRGAGTPIIRINGVKELHGCEYTIIPDMIEAGTFMVAAAATKGKLYINNVIPKHLETITAKLREMGVIVEEFDEAVMVSRGKSALSAVNVKTLPYPGFPTDMQAQIISLMCLSEGSGVISETIFENRFMHVQELVRMGADIRLSGHTAIIRGVQRLAGAPVMASDLRASASLVLAGLAAKGTTTVQRIYHLDRGYEHIENKLNAVGARIRREAE